MTSPLNKYLVKIAAKIPKEDLSPQQKELLDKWEKNKGVVAHHSMGSGKTKAFLTAAQRVHQRDKEGRVLVLAPASLVSNVDKEIKKHKLKGIDRNRLDVYSYEKASNIADQLAQNKYLLTIADEAHKLRNPKTKRTRSLRGIIESSDSRILATATGNYNHLADISPLINMASGGKYKLPEDRSEAEKQWVEEKTKSRNFSQVIKGEDPEVEQKLRPTADLIKGLKDHVHYYDSEDDPEAQKHFPKLTSKTIEVDMSPEQQRYYRFAEGQLPWMLRMKIRHNLPMDKKEKANLNAFSTGIRQTSTGYRHLDASGRGQTTPKVQQASRALLERAKKDRNFRGIVYSNYLSAGLQEYENELKRSKIPYAVYSGETKPEDKKRIVEDYNNGKIKALLVSSSGGEGLDTKGTKLVQTLDGHFNKAKVDQVVGRSKRYKSHSHLPEDERKVEVEHYHSVFPKSMFGQRPTSIDSYLWEHADKKNTLFDDVKDLMRKHSK